MNDIIRMAREAGFADAEGVVHPAYQLEAFANLVATRAAALEREECAKLCDGLDDDLVDGLAGWQYGEAIRARGQS
jgi:hypothetical protein